MFKVARNVIPVKFHPGGDTHSVRISISYNKLGFGFQIDTLRTMSIDTCMNSKSKISKVYYNRKGSGYNYGNRYMYTCTIIRIIYFIIFCSITGFLHPREEHRHMPFITILIITLYNTFLKHLCSLHLEYLKQFFQLGIFSVDNVYLNCYFIH